MTQRKSEEKRDHELESTHSNHYNFEHQNQKKSKLHWSYKNTD